MHDTPLWHARNIGEHAYCPRLFYYMQVEGVFLPSADTEEGADVHRRVDQPSLAPRRASPDTPTSDDPPAPPVAEDPDRPRTVRSLHLTSEDLHLTARLDLAEITESDPPTAVPVEYRKGRPRRLTLRDAEIPEEEEPGQFQIHRVEPWPTDRVQVGLQVLLLEAHGFRVPRAVLYYAAERRRIEIEVDDALRRAALAELEAAKATAAGPRPLPLIDDPKCPRCSLQPICLPDEVNHQRTSLTVEGVAPDPPRRMWPPRDDGIHVVAQRDGVRLGIVGQSLRFTDRDGAIVKDMPIAGMESLAIVGHVQASTQALHLFASRGVPVVYDRRRANRRRARPARPDRRVGSPRPGRRSMIPPPALNSPVRSPPPRSRTSGRCCCGMPPNCPAPSLTTWPNKPGAPPRPPPSTPSSGTKAPPHGTTSSGSRR